MKRTTKVVWMAMAIIVFTLNLLSAEPQWLVEAAEQGKADAQYRLGEMYYDGKGVEKDYKKAFEWYLKAAEQGHEWAQSSIGLMYCLGRGVKLNYTKALEWYLKMAEQGSAWGQSHLS